MNRWLMQTRQAFVFLPVISLLVGCQSVRIKSGPLPESITRMHNIVIAIRAYADDHQGRMPPLQDITSLRTALRGYIHDAETFTDSSAGGTGFVTNRNLPARLDEVVSSHPEEWVIAAPANSDLSGTYVDIQGGPHKGTPLSPSPSNRPLPQRSNRAGRAKAAKRMDLHHAQQIAIRYLESRKLVPRDKKISAGYRKKYVRIGAIPGDPQIAAQVDKVLARAGIKADIDGSKSYGIVVARSDQAKAVALLKKAAQGRKLHIWFGEPAEVHP